ncbi:MAG: hypothetical protein ACO1OB_23100 [Archangium sp.]
MTVAVTRSEANLLTLARVAVGVVPPIDAMRLLVSPVTPPSKLGPTARGLLSDTLARGTVRALARNGGWLERSWERVTPKLEFTPNTIRLFSWLLSTPLSEVDVAPLVLPTPPTPAEDALLAMLLDHLRGSGCEAAIARQLELRRWPMTVLTHAAFMSRDVGLDEAPAFDIEALAPWLENMRVLLSRSWLLAEKAKRNMVQVDAIARMGRGQTVVLNAWLDAVDRAKRRDLASFLIDVGARYFSKSREPDDVVPSMNSDVPLRDRTEAKRLAGATWRALARLHTWDQEHRVVRFIEDDYEQAQRLIRDWERLGERGFGAAQTLVSLLDALGPK